MIKDNTTCTPDEYHQAFSELVKKYPNPENRPPKEKLEHEAVILALKKKSGISMELFFKKELIKEILGILSNDHLGDDNLKMTAFLTAVSALLTDPKLRQSVLLTGLRSVGKDNLIKAILKQMPIDSFIFVTSATTAVLQDDIKDKRIIAISELNLFRDDGANKNLLEVLKQRTEGGTASMKKDLRVNNKELRYETAEQGSVICGTTDLSRDDELSTRMINGSVTSDSDRIQKVNEKTFDRFSSEEDVIRQSKDEETEIRKILTVFFKNNIQYYFVLPYAKFLKEKINGEDIFDYSDPRSQRDIKRLLSLTCAMTYVFQLQRKHKTVNGVHFLVSEVQDFIETLRYSQEFFDSTYFGLDERLSKVLDTMDELIGTWCNRKLLQEKLGVSRNTMKAYCKDLADFGLIEGSKGCEIDVNKFPGTYDSNCIYYRRYQKGIKKVLVRCQIDKLEQFLLEKMKIEEERDIDDNKSRVSKTGCQNDQNMPCNTTKTGKIDTLKLTPFDKKEPTTQAEVIQKMQDEALGNIKRTPTTPVISYPEYKEPGDENGT